MAPRQRRKDGRRGERLFLDLLCPQGPHGCAAVTIDELRQATELAFMHGLFLLIDARIRAHAAAFPAGLVSGEYAQSVRSLRERHISHALRYERVERGVLALLDAAAVRSVILKGSSLSLDLFGDPHCRTSADIDLLVRPEDVPAADAALNAAGYRRDNDRPLSFWMRRLHHAVYEHPDSRLPVEIHWNFSIPGFFNLDPAAIWDAVTLEGLRGRLEPAMTLTLLLMHHHLHGCADLRALVDLVWAFERFREQRDSAALPEHLASTGLLVVARIAQRQAERLWGAQDWHLGRRSLIQALRAGLLARAAGVALRPGRRPRARDRFLHVAIHRLGLDSPRRVLAAITKTLLPSAADLRELSGGEQSRIAASLRYFQLRLGGRAAGRQGQWRARL